MFHKSFLEHYSFHCKLEKIWKLNKKGVKMCFVPVLPTHKTNGTKKREKGYPQNMFFEYGTPTLMYVWLYPTANPSKAS